MTPNYSTPTAPDKKAAPAASRAAKGPIAGKSPISGKGPTAGNGPITLAIDIGGSGLKAMLLDAAGQPVSERQRVVTPAVPSPKAVLVGLDTLRELLPAFDRVSVGFPGVIKHGTTFTAVNLHPGWAGFPALRRNLTQGPFYAAFLKATNSVLVAAMRCALSSRYRRFL